MTLTKQNKALANQALAAVNNSWPHKINLMLRLAYSEPTNQPTKSSSSLCNKLTMAPTCLQKNGFVGVQELLLWKTEWFESVCYLIWKNDFKPLTLRRVQTPTVPLFSYVISQLYKRSVSLTILSSRVLI